SIGHNARRLSVRRRDHRAGAAGERTRTLARAAAHHQPCEACADQNNRQRVVTGLPSQVSHELPGAAIASEIESLIDDAAGRHALAKFAERSDDLAASRFGFAFKLHAGSHGLSPSGASPPKRPLVADGLSCSARAVSASSYRRRPTEGSIR